jgi:hypothetical protein
MQEELVLPSGYEYLREDCKQFLARNRPYSRNVFLMMRFDSSDNLLTQVDEQLRRTLCRHGLVARRADDVMYASDQQLWSNVCVYMLCCKYGVAVLEDTARDEFNPNVALEFGFMRALGKKALLLTDRGFKNLRADIVGTLREEFDISDVSTLAKPIGRWIRSLGVGIHAGPSDLQQAALNAYRRLLNIYCSLRVRDEAKQIKEWKDEIWYFGEEIETYRKVLLQYPDTKHQDAVDRAAFSVVEKHDNHAVEELIEVFRELAQR